MNGKTLTLRLNLSTPKLERSILSLKLITYSLSCYILQMFSLGHRLRGLYSAGRLQLWATMVRIK